MLDTTIQVKTDRFDGPLGLLLMLVKKEEMSIRDLDLNKITSQYLNYLAQMEELNFDVAGEYLFLAATLLLLKSNNCVTEEEQNKLQDELGENKLNITTEAELLRRLEELQHFQKIGELLWQLPKKNEDFFCRPKINRKEIINSVLTPVELQELTSAMMDLIFREKRKYTVVRRDRLSIKEKLNFLKNYLQVGERTHFNEILAKDGGGNKIDNTVITFISLLELARLKQIKIFQNEGHGNIYVDTVNSLNDFNVDTANGFEEEGMADEDKTTDGPQLELDNKHTIKATQVVQ